MTILAPLGGTISWRKIQSSPTDKATWQALFELYLSHNMVWPAVYVAKQIQRLDPSASNKLNELLSPLAWQGASEGDAVLGRHALVQAKEQLERFTDWLKIHPEDWLAWLYVVRLADFLEPVDAALQTQAFESALAFEYIPGESAHLLGVWRLKAGDVAGAFAAFAPLVNIRPLRHGSMMYLGEVLLRQGNHLAAEKAFTRASLSNHPDFLSLLATTVYQHNFWQEAVAVLKKALSIKPNDAQLWLQLAKIQSQTYQLSDCKASLAQIKRLGSSQEADLLAISLEGGYGDAKAYLDRLQAILRASGDKNSRMISSILMTSLYQDDLTVEEIANLHQTHCSALVSDNVRFAERSTKDASNINTNRPLRIAYVTGDLHRQHPVNLFLLPLLREQNKSSLEVYVYYTGVMFDGYTELARSYVDQWREAVNWDDALLQQEIAKDEIDVLIDLAGHTSSHRLGVFIGRPAPVQVTFLGYPHSTGLPCMNYIIGDAIVSPPEHAHLFSEKIERIEGSVFCWSPVDQYPLPKPRDPNTPLVFGSFNNALKLSPKTIALWAKVLLALPDSRLLLKAPSFRDLEVQKRYQDLFESHQIGSDRIEFRGPSELSQMMQEYGDIDIALDPLVYNGGTTSMQALWMGTPLVTLQGKNFTSRMGASFLRVLDKSEWIAQDEDGYIAVVQNLAKRVLEIRQGRAALREQMASSALCDIQAYAKKFEGLLHKMYQSTTTG